MSRYYTHFAVYNGTEVVFRSFYEYPAKTYAAKHGGEVREEKHITEQRKTVPCVKCGSRAIRANEYLDFGNGTGQHIVCPN